MSGLGGLETRDAILSLDGTCRYALKREVGTLEATNGQVLFVMLNPSTADATEDDPTIRRCIRFARDWGYCRLLVANLYPFRATKPDDLWAWLPDDPQHLALGANRTWLTHLARHADLVVAAWGTLPRHARQHAESVLGTLQRHAGAVHSIRVTKEGFPGHPLYVPASAQPAEVDIDFTPHAAEASGV